MNIRKLLLVVACCAPGITTADQFGNFTFTDNGTSITITDYPDNATGKVVIPASINGKPVISIGDGAFSGLLYVESIIIPDSVTSIGYAAFSSCQSLTYVKIGNQVTSIGKSAFIASAVSSIIIPSSVTNIGEYAFRQGQLKWASFQGSPPTIGFQAFYMQPQGFKVHFNPSISGWTSPSWEGLPSAPGVAPSITSAPPSVRHAQGDEYNHYFAAEGTPSPVFVVTDGALPREMTLFLSGRLFGYPADYGIFTATVTALNGFGPEASQTITIDTNEYRMMNVTAINGVIQGTGEHLLNSTATLTANPSPGYLFTGWTGDATGTDNPLSVLMDADKNIGATFTPDTSDTDGDGLSNWQEITQTLTNPAMPDTDGDTVNDSMDAFPLDPAETLDTDNDGTGDNADTDDDGDGLSDTDETSIHGTNPKLADSDGDGLTDPAELLTHLTNPLVADSDNDGLSDGAEVNTHGSNPKNADTDADGFLDGYEVFTGKSPLDPLIKPALVAEARTAIEFTFPAQLGKSYRIEASTDLSTWATVETGIAGNGSQVVRFYSTRGMPQRYFRVEENTP